MAGGTEKHKPVIVFLMLVLRVREWKWHNDVERLGARDKIVSVSIPVEILGCN